MKKALAGLALVLALGAIGVYVALHYVDVIVKVALERYGPEVAGVKVKVADVEISPRDGRGSIRGLEIGNPPGFTSARAARLGEIRVVLDPTTLTGKVIRIHEIAIVSPQVTYERGARATNLDVIQSHIEAYMRKASGEEGGAAKAPRPEKRRFLIDRLSIRGGRVLMTNPALRGQGVSFDLPEVLLRDVGRRQGGVTASEAAALVTGTLQNRIAQKVLTNIDLLRRGGLEGAVDALKGLIR